MAQQTIVTVVCDLPHDGETEGTETISFAFDGTGYEVDVCAKHAKDLREGFSKYIDAGRRSSASRPSAAPRRAPRAGREHTAEIRKWAQQRGHKVSDRGRIPAAVVAEYESTH